MGIEGIENLQSGTDPVHDVNTPSETTAETEARHESELEEERRLHREVRESGMAERQELQKQVDATHTQTAGPVTQ